LPNSNCHGVLHPRYTRPLETLLASPPGGPEGKYYWAPGYGGDVIGGQLVLVSACLTANPLITGGQEHTHTHLSCLPPVIAVAMAAARRWGCGDGGGEGRDAAMAAARGGARQWRRWRQEGGGEDSGAV
jgi:hypothetical protein